MFQRVIERTPESFRGYANLGATYLYEAKYSEAIKPLEQSLAIHATADTYSNLGTAYYYQHRFKDAAQTYEKAVQLNGKDYTNWGNLGEARYLDGDRDKSVQAFEHAVDLAKEELAVNSHDPQLLKYLAGYYARIGDRTHAFECLNSELK